MNQIIYAKSIKISVNRSIKYCLIVIISLLLSCTTKVPDCNVSNSEPIISPDYAGITLPPNIAPLNFTINEKADQYLVKFDSRKGSSFIIDSDDGQVIIPIRKWHKLLNSCKGSDIFMDVFARKRDQWLKFKTITNHVSEDSIDNHLVYRLISPGFELWHKMGIYQRNLENFDEDPIMISDMSDNSCMNCHSFCKNSSNTMLFHMRGKLSGTIIRRNGKTTLVNTKTDQTISPAVYPAWHPNGRYIAFSVNQIVQSFHAVPDKKIEVIDTLSDLILFDAEKNIILKSKKIATKTSFETFPCWSPDGNYLYYCNAKALSFRNYNQIRYDLMKIAFNPATTQFGAIDTVVSSSRTGLSVSFPRISPDGKYLMFCMSKYGNFSIWHKGSDLYLLNLESKEITKPDLNSDQSESYHQWSSTGRWIVFSSRRTNGLFTRLYFSHFNKDGKAQKPFILPQKQPDFYEGFMKSFNIPELVTSKVALDSRELYDIARSKPVNVTVQNIN